MSVVSVVCCQVEVSATSLSLVQGSPTECGASLCVCDLATSWIRRPWPALACSATNKKYPTDCLHTPGLPQWHVLSVLQDDNQPSDGLFHHKPIDLEKLFTPASDSGEATPSRNSKFLASAP